MHLRTPPMPPQQAHGTLSPHATAPPQPGKPPPLAQHNPPALQQHGTPSQPLPALRPAATAPQRAAAHLVRDRQGPHDQPHAAPPDPAAASHRTPVSPGPARMPAQAPQPRFRSGAPRKACAVFRAPGRARSAPRHRRPPSRRPRRRAVATRPAYHSVSFVTDYLPPKIEKNSELFRTRPLSGLRNGAVGPATRLRTPRRRCARPGRAPPHRPIPEARSTAGQPLRTPPAMPSRDLRQGSPHVRMPPGAAHEALRRRKKSPTPRKQVPGFRFFAYLCR